MTTLHIQNLWGYRALSSSTKNTRPVENVPEPLASEMVKMGALTIPCVGYMHNEGEDVPSLRIGIRKVTVCFELGLDWPTLEHELRVYNCGPLIYLFARRLSMQFRKRRFRRNYDNLQVARALADGTMDVPFGIARARAAFLSVTGGELAATSAKKGFDILRVAAQMWAEEFGR